MNSRKLVLVETGIVAVGQIVCTGLMFGVFALLHRFDQTVLWGGIIGALLATANFFFMALGAMIAADKAEKENVNGGKMTIRSSYLLRQILLVVLLFACAYSGYFNVVALVLPLIFVRPTLTISEFFRKKEG